MSTREAERLRVEDFLTAFNEIEIELKTLMGMSSDEGFSRAARAYVDQNPSWQTDYSVALAFAKLRNVIVHERTSRYSYLAIPTEDIVGEIQALRDRLIRPRTAFDEFQRQTVATLQADATLEQLLNEVHEHDFTQFPVYDKKDFRGLVTSNGVTRWLAEHVMEEGISYVALADHAVGDVLAREEDRQNWAFVKRTAPVRDVVHMFQANPQLEAVLVTHSGRKTEKLLGIATQWDIAKLDPE